MCKRWQIGEVRGREKVYIERNERKRVPCSFVLPLKEGKEEDRNLVRLRGKSNPFLLAFLVSSVTQVQVKLLDEKRYFFIWEMAVFSLSFYQLPFWACRRLKWKYVEKRENEKHLHMILNPRKIRSWSQETCVRPVFELCETSIRQVILIFFLVGEIDWLKNGTVAWASSFEVDLCLAGYISIKVWHACLTGQ